MTFLKSFSGELTNNFQNNLYCASTQLETSQDISILER